LLDATTVYVIGVICFATLIRSTLGFGEALVAVPLLALCLPVSIAAPLAVLVSVAIAAVIVFQDWRHVHFRSAMGLILSALPGIPLGILLLTQGNEHLVRLILGSIIAGFSFYSLRAKTTFHLGKDHPQWLLGCGFLSGILGGAYGMNGPPLAIYGTLQGWSPQHFRATLQGYFLVTSLAGLVGYSAMGLWNESVTRYFLLSFPAVIMAILIGRTLNQRMESNGVFRFVYMGLIALGGILVIQAIL
jgi:uncharacterized membrane protein YfcA